MASMIRMLQFNFFLVCICAFVDLLVAFVRFTPNVISVALGRPHCVGLIVVLNQSLRVTFLVSYGVHRSAVSLSVLCNGCVGVMPMFRVTLLVTCYIFLLI